MMELPLLGVVGVAETPLAVALEAPPKLCCEVNTLFPEEPPAKTSVNDPATAAAVYPPPAPPLDGPRTKRPDPPVVVMFAVPPFNPFGLPPVPVAGCVDPPLPAAVAPAVAPANLPEVAPTKVVA
jgi:hypothetical protein